jgi:8-oxo-dGDP phosphatase
MPTKLRTALMSAYLREDEVIRPGGAAAGTCGVVELRPSCGIAAINEHNEIALVRQWRYVSDEYSLKIPTGGLEQGETPLAAAKRELLEETGLAARDWSTLGTIDISNGATDVAHLFLARNLTAGPPLFHGDEQLELRWMPFADAVLAAMNGEITESASVAAILRRNFWSGKVWAGAAIPAARVN